MTNFWGRPLEFRLSTAVQPNKVQQILYGSTLRTFVSGELIGKTLFEKTATAASIVFTDSADALQLRRVIDVPVVLVGSSAQSEVESPDVIRIRPGSPGRLPVACSSQFAGDGPNVKELLDRLGQFDLAEPFVRIRDAMSEARKLGVSQRAA